MYCPGCGKENSIEQKFCRDCGMNLENSAASLREQFPNSARTSLEREEKLHRRFGQIAFTGFAIVVDLAIIAMIYFIFTNMVLSGDRPWTGVFLIAFILFAGLSLAYVIWNESIKEKREKLQQTPAPEALPTPPTGKLLNESTIEPVPSVVEDTTKLLKQPRER